MQENRRAWLKQMSLGIAGLGIAPFQPLASPATNYFTDVPSDNAPIRLSSNENPYGPSSLAIKAMTESLKFNNRYNWEITSDLITAIAAKNNITQDNILLGAGSTEILDLTVQLFASSRGSFIVANPSYTNWTRTAVHLGLRKISVPLTIGKQIDLPAMLAAIESDTRFIYVCNPNNPTGTICENNALISFIKEATKKVMVLVDEAYLDFTSQESMSSLAIENKNLVVVKTFSKIYGLAGARLGYAIAHTDTLRQIEQLQTWGNGGIGVTTRMGAIASLKDEGFVKECVSLNKKARTYTTRQLEQLNINCIPSHTNFIYFSLANYSRDFFMLLKTNNIQGTGIYEEAGKWTRITVGTMQEMGKFIGAIS